MLIYIVVAGSKVLHSLLVIFSFFIPIITSSMSHQYNLCTIFSMVILHHYASSFSAFFVYSSLRSYNNKRREKFLSLDDQAGICKDIPKDVTGTFRADTYGNWEGEEGFEFSEAIYNFQFFHLETTENNFYQVVDRYLDQLDVLNEVMRTNNFAITVLYWTAWLMRVDGSEPFSDDYNAHYFSLTGGLLFVYKCVWYELLC